MFVSTFERRPGRAVLSSLSRSRSRTPTLHSWESRSDGGRIEIARRSKQRLNGDSSRRDGQTDKQTKRANKRAFEREKERISRDSKVGRMCAWMRRVEREREKCVKGTRMCVCVYVYCMYLHGNEWVFRFTCEKGTERRSDGTKQ